MEDAMVPRIGRRDAMDGVRPFAAGNSDGPWNMFQGQCLARSRSLDKSNRYFASVR